MHKRICLSDCHFPFQDKPLVDLWLKFVKDQKPDGIDIMGDLIDCYPLSRFDKNPLRRHNIQEELGMARDFLKCLVKAAPKKCDIRYSEGNHENRLQRVLWGRAKELAPLHMLSIPELLSLQGVFNIKYYPPETPYRIGPLWYIHGDLARKSNWAMTCGGMGAKAVSQRVAGNVIMGHTHQMGYISFRGWEGLREGFEVGCMCRFNLEYIVGTPQWQSGWAVVDFPTPGTFDVSFVRVLEEKRRRKVIYRGEVIGTLPPIKRHL